MFIMHTLIIRDVDLNIIDIIEIEPDTELTRAEVRALLNVHKDADAIERIVTVERRLS